jgi:hypothetical protein
MGTSEGGTTVRTNSYFRALILAAAAALVAVLCTATPVCAEGPSPQIVVAGQVLRGHFTQDRELAGFSKPLRSEGSFVLAPGKGLIWRGEKPFSNVTIISADGVLQIANGQEAMRLPASRVPGLSHLYEVLGAAVSGNIKPLQQTFAVTQSAAGAGWRVVLKPLHPENPAMSQLKSLTMEGNRYVESVVVEKSGGDMDRITFSDHQVSTASLTADEVRLLKAAKK